MEIINFRAVERSTQDVSGTINMGSSERWTIQSQKTKYINGKRSGVIDVGYTASINNSDYLLEEDKSNNQIQITARNDGTSGLCVLTQNESGNKINLHLTTPEEKKDYWEIRFTILLFGTPLDNPYLITIKSNIKGESSGKNWIVNQNRHTLNIYLLPRYQDPPENPEGHDLLSWSCLDKNGKAFSPNYNLPDNQYFTTKTTGLGSYTLTQVSTPIVSNGTLILSGRFNPTKKYPLDLNFYWGAT